MYKYEQIRCVCKYVLSATQQLSSGDKALCLLLSRIIYKEHELQFNINLN